MKIIILTMSCLTLCCLGLRGEVELVKRDVERLPIYFVDYGRQLISKEKWTSPVLRNVSSGFLNEDHYKDYVFVERAIGPSNQCWIGSTQGNGQGPDSMNPPFSLITGVEVQSGMFVGGLNRVGTSEMGDGLKSEAIRDLSTFDLLDFFGCSPNSALYEFIGSIDYNGFLVLPFGGTDFSRFKRFPSGVTKLIVYNSFLDNNAINYIQDLTDMKELVLWNCAAPNNRLESFTRIFERVESLTLIGCSGAIKDTMWEANWTQLRFFTYNGEVSRLKRMTLPSIERVYYYLQYQPKYEKGDEMNMKSVLHDLFRGRDGKFVHFSIRPQAEESQIFAPR